MAAIVLIAVAVVLLLLLTGVAIWYFVLRKKGETTAPDSPLLVQLQVPPPSDASPQVPSAPAPPPSDASPQVPSAPNPPSQVPSPSGFGLSAPVPAATLTPVAFTDISGIYTNSQNNGSFIIFECTHVSGSGSFIIRNVVNGQNMDRPVTYTRTDNQTLNVEYSPELYVVLTVSNGQITGDGETFIKTGPSSCTGQPVVQASITGLSLSQNFGADGDRAPLRVVLSPSNIIGDIRDTDSVLVEVINSLNLVDSSTTTTISVLKSGVNLQFFVPVGIESYNVKARVTVTRSGASYTSSPITLEFTT